MMHGVMTGDARVGQRNYRQGQAHGGHDEVCHLECRHKCELKTSLQYIIACAKLVVTGQKLHPTLDVPDAGTVAPIMHTCLGLSWLGQCNYDPAAPSAIYFSPGSAVGALVFTLAVQQLLRPIYRFRLSARYLRLPYLYFLVFAAVIAALIAVLVPNFRALHGGPWGYANVWEIVASVLFIFAYGAVALAVLLPIRVRPERMTDFARGVAHLLSEANETDHVDLISDLGRSLPILFRTASFGENIRETTAFFDFIYRHEIEQAVYALTLLRIIADPHFCATLVTCAPWRVALMLREISAKYLYARNAEQFIRELARQAILRDDSMMAREIGYHGFRTAPLLSESLFSDPFIIERYNPFDTTFSTSDDAKTASVLKRFNNAVERCYTTLIEQGQTFNSQAAFSIQNFYQSIFMTAYKFRETDEYDYRATTEMYYAVRVAWRMANKLLVSVTDVTYRSLYVSNSTAYRSDVLETLVEIVYDALNGIANRFKGSDDPFWMLAIDVMHDIFYSIGEQPDGMTPFQQRLALKIIQKLNQNMRGLYPAICRVLLATVGPYHQPAEQPNRTAFNILKDAMYISLRRFPQLARIKPEKVSDYLPPIIQYDQTTSQFIYTYRDGSQSVTDLRALKLAAFSLTSPRLRRSLTDEDRRHAERAF